MVDVWVLIRLALGIGAFFGLPLYLVLRAMARRVVDDRRFERAQDIRNAEDLMSRCLLMTAAFLTVRWQVSLGLALFTLPLSAIILIGLIGAKPQNFWGRLVDRGPTAERAWLVAAAILTAALVFDPIFSNHPLFQPGLLIAVFWCVAWSLISRVYREWRDDRTRYRGP